jgi:hypothetical protein
MKKGAQTGDNAIGRAQVGRTLASAIEDQELMPDEHRFGNHATGAWGLASLDGSGRNGNAGLLAQDNTEIVTGHASKSSCDAILGLGQLGPTRSVRSVLPTE